MKKKILIFSITLSFFCLFFLHPSSLFAESSNNSSNSDQTTSKGNNSSNPLQELLNTIANFFQHLIFGTNYISDDYDAPSSYNTKEVVNDYASDYNDYSSRTIAETDRTRRKGVYFYEVLFEKSRYQDKTIKDSSSECPKEILIKDIVCFYRNKYNSGETQEKILYKRGEKEPTDYSQVSDCKQLENNDQCYINAYINFQDIPQESFEGKEDLAPITSTQLNESIRTYIPQNRQGESAPATNDDKDKIKALVDDSNKQEEVMLLNFIPKKTQDDIECTNLSNINRDNLRNAFECQLSEYKRGTSDCGLGPEIDPQADCGKPGDDYKLNGEGISQHGAHGLALYGFKYNQIINKYFGDNATTNTFDGIDEGEITVILIDELDRYNKEENCEPYATRTSGKYNLFDLNKELETKGSNAGAVYIDGSPCELIEIKDEKTQQIIRYEVKDKGEKIGNTCYPTIILSRKHYLFGIAEVPNFWHIESLKALTLAFRHEVYRKTQVLSTGLQVFLCSRGLENIPEEKYFEGVLPPEITNQRAAVELTKNELVVDKNNIESKREDATHFTAFCSRGSSNPSFDGTDFELKSRGLWGNEVGEIAKFDRINGICFTGVNETTVDSNVLGVTSTNSTINNYPNRKISTRSKTVNASLQNNFYHFNDTTSQSPIKENYDLVDVDNGKWLTSFPKFTDCQLDNRVFPALTSLIEKLNQEIPNNSLIPKNCYRDFETQSKLWYQGLVKYRDTYTNLLWHSFPGTSIHQTGRVVDFYDQNGRLDQSSSVYQWLVKNASNFGFYHYKLEPWHWEYNP